MSKISLSQISIIFSVKIDSVDRINNLRRNLQFHQMFFEDYEIVVVEQDVASRLGDILVEFPSVRHFFYYSKNCHYKTHNLNLATSLAKRQIIMMLDVDVIYNPKSILSALQEFENGADFVAPYNGIVAGIRKECLNHFNSPEDYSTKLVFFDYQCNQNLDKYDLSLMYPILGGNNYINTGGCIMYRKDAFYAIGAWNTNFISYGNEDKEFVYRIGSLGYEIKRFDSYNIYHFEHERNEDSYYNTFASVNEDEWNKVVNMSFRELLEYVHNGYREIELMNDREVIFHNNKSVFSLEVIKTQKIDLTDLSIIIPLNFENKEHLPVLNSLVKYMNYFYHNHEIIMVEMGSRVCKNLKERKNVKYYWLGNTTFELSKVIEKGRSESKRSLIAIWDFRSFIEPAIVLENYAKLKHTSLQEIHLEDCNWNWNMTKKIGVGTGATFSQKTYS